MGLLLLVMGSIVGLFLIVGIAVMVTAALAWLFWMIARLGLTAMMVAAIVLAGELIDADARATGLLAILASIGALVATRRWGQTAEPQLPTSLASRASSKPAAMRPRSAEPTPPEPTQLVPAELQARLDATERALAHAARDAHGSAADEWLTLWRRVPDLIKAARDHHEDLDMSGQAATIAQLTQRLNELIGEAEDRIAIAKRSRADEFTIRANHVENRVRHG